ncbi:laccase-7 [Agaricus bisporus var. bisporus H97]|uniref:laccase-7 n=1 Tax=Agaricus bisporus var. bisporus (strain H97 / ATCC MYA-4626 / FGSC 10389) TaxID=936046 RepID=UPI00029F5697|nr:laccase-7 [Agaricus bisporus var. bisporus H97]EKV48764.1 laccase-7 [Agaricus bisporus var. bisporus H97]
MQLKLQFASLLLWATAISASRSKVIGPKGTITLANQDFAPDGFTRSASLINGIHPGPVITANKGDQIKINVVNELTDPDQTLGASIHWHGLFQRSTNFMDGVIGVTQCPIAPNNSFEYSLDTTDQSGTFWYHSHFGVQYCDGIRGALIVYDPEDPLKDMYDVDDENTIITLADWYHILAPDVFGIEIEDSTLINGLGRYGGGPKVDLAVVNVKHGKRYRLRLISMSCNPDYVFSIDQHELTIIETEGTETIPETVNSIHILAGQRYSAVLHANQTVDNYWIRALPNRGNNGLNETFDGGVNSAILRYKGARKREPTTQQQNQTIPLIEANLHPVNPIPVPGEHTPDGADQTFTFTLELNATDPIHVKWSFNNTVFETPTVPVLLQILSGATEPHELLPQGSIYHVQRNKTIQLNIPTGLIGGPHPFHLHGHEFWVVKTAESDEYNFDNPVVRDTVSAGLNENGYVSIRFRTDNPGPWILHCHIDFHLRDGLAIVFAEDPADTDAANSPRPAAWDQLCPTWDALPESVKNAGSRVF